MILLLDERQRKELAQYSPYIAIPKVSSQNRRYIPMDYLEGEIIPGDKLFTMPSATSYEFGILMSNVHMAWTRAVCGRLKSDYSYSNMIVYNNFPWPSPTNDQKEKIRKTAQAILNARALYTDSNLADLYDPLTMPTELLKAHKANNRAVMHAYTHLRRAFVDALPPDQKKKERLIREKPLLEAFWSWAEKSAIGELPKSKLSKAFHYALNNREGFWNYLEDGNCSISNSLAENCIRPFVIGRKNWLFSGSPKGAEASAGIYTLFYLTLTAKA